MGPCAVKAGDPSGAAAGVRNVSRSLGGVLADIHGRRDLWPANDPDRDGCCDSMPGPAPRQSRRKGNGTLLGRGQIGMQLRQRSRAAATGNEQAAAIRGTALGAALLLVAWPLAAAGTA